MILISIDRHWALIEGVFSYTDLANHELKPHAPSVNHKKYFSIKNVVIFSEALGGLRMYFVVGKAKQGDLEVNGHRC